MDVRQRLLLSTESARSLNTKTPINFWIPGGERKPLLFHAFCRYVSCYNLFKDAITIECEDSTLHKNQSLEIKTNDYIELINCKDALIFYSNKSIKYGFDQRFNSRYYVIKKSRIPKLEIRVEVPTEQEGSKILNEVKNKHKE